MRTIYIDSDFKCHLENADGRTAVETDVFDDICNGAIECYTYRPLENGCFVQCFDTPTADKLRKQHQADEDAHLAEIAELIEEVYNSDLEMIGE